MADPPPQVTTFANFDSVLVPPDHVSRQPNDTYYVTADTVLRCHTSAHQLEMLKQGAQKFLAGPYPHPLLHLNLSYPFCGVVVKDDTQLI